MKTPFRGTRLLFTLFLLAGNAALGYLIVTLLREPAPASVTTGAIMAGFAFNYLMLG